MLLISQNSNLIKTTSGTCTLDLSNVPIGWYGYTEYNKTLSGYTPIGWSIKISDYAGLLAINAENVNMSNGSLYISFFATPLANQARISHTVTVYVTWLKTA